eukprot:TRINITY_DN12319_c0_g1_i1.p1 TRINITY_DN12319_c0_g1~~TRINITY_DN12319_c0_g1_i1.p1  ORF type:complete len:134 (+),score=24.91 TRINITY_DN12319_c0_g1_i1:107-508(+)
MTSVGSNVKANGSVQNLKSFAQTPVGKTDGTEREGFLMKEGLKFKTWKYRYFVLKKNTLTFYKGAEKLEAGEPQGRIFLDESCSVSDSEEYKQTEYVFSLATPRRTFFLSASSHEDKMAWVNSLSRVLAMAYD